MVKPAIKDDNTNKTNALIAIVASVALSIAAWALIGLIDVDKRVTAIESNRFTASDAMREFGRINEAIALIPREVPPVWFKEKVDQIAKNQQLIMNDIAALRVALKKGLD